MSWVTNTFKSTIGRKLLMALTGIFLILFLTVHLIGNLQLLKDDNGESFNAYAHFMGHNALIQTISIGNFAFILLHIIIALVLTLVNKKARPVDYSMKKDAETSNWSSRNMGLLGTIILVFLVVHLQNFWGQMKFGSVPLDEFGNKNLYMISVEAFRQEWLVGLYVVSMIFLAFHLSHGFQSAFQTLGLNHKKYTPLINALGLIFSIVVPGLFALIPILTYIKNI